MKTIQNFILEKLQINKNSKIKHDKDEEFYEKTSTDLLTEIQNDVDKKGEYHTYTIDGGQKKFKKGFLTLLPTEDAITITAFNTAKEFADLLGADEDLYDDYETLEVGEFGEFDEGQSSTKVLRIW